MTPSSHKEPANLVIGDTWSWHKTIDCYPPSDGWTLSYVLRGPKEIPEITATSDDTCYSVSVAADVTVDYTEGLYFWVAYLTKDGARKQVDDGRFILKPNLAVAKAAYDGRSQAEKDLEAVRAALADNLGNQQYMIGNRQLIRYMKSELLALEKSLASRVARERRDAAMVKGAPAFKNTLARFR